MPSSAPTIDFDVLIVGAGPAGASLASFLAQNNITNILMISAAPSTAREPRAHYTNLATMDTLRDLGLEEHAYSRARFGDSVSHIRWGESMSGVEYARAWLGGNKPDRWSEYAAASPCRTCDLPQTELEPLLVGFAGRKGVSVRFSTELVGSEEGGDGRVVSRLKDLITGVEYEVRSQYLCGADGGRSLVARLLDLPMVGTPRPPAYNIMVKADMAHLMANRGGSLHYCLHLDKDYPFVPLWRAVKPWTQWILIIFPKPGQSYEQPTNEYWMQVIRDTIGDSTVEAEILGVSKWVINETYAQQSSKGNVFCLGDAVHRHPPTGGLGSNTCVQDSYNLAWKMSLVLKGLASPRLLETYSRERQPVGQNVVARANQALHNYAPIFDALGVMLPTSQERKQAIDVLSGATDDGARLRKQLRDGLLKVADQEMQALGTEMGQLYTSPSGGPSAVYTLDETGPYVPRGEEAADPLAFYTPSTYPGRRLPHVWLDKAKPSKPVSTIDLAGKGSFCLFTGANGIAWKLAAQRTSDKPGGVRFNAYTIGFRQDWEDVYGDWARICEVDGIEEDGCVLVRPDLFVAWRARTMDEDAEGKLLKVMRAVLCLE